MKDMIKIQLMKISDIAKVIHLGKKAGLGMALEKRETHEMKQMIIRNPNSCFVAKVQGQVVGCIFGAGNGRRAWIYHLAIDHNWQRQGIGSELLNKTCQVFKAQKITKIILGVHITILKTIPFYEQNGFKVMSDAVLLEKDMWRGGENYEV